MVNKADGFFQILAAILFIFSAVFTSCNNQSPVQSDNQTSIPSDQEITEFTIRHMSISPLIVEVGKPITITAELSGRSYGKNILELTVNGNYVQQKEILFDPKDFSNVEFIYIPESPGLYNIDLKGSIRTVLVIEPGSSLLELIEAQYPELYNEMVKLPELEEIDDKDNEAIYNITLLALNPDYRTIFNQLLNEGIKDKRKYCTPLQALLWIAYDKKFSEDNPLDDYSLRDLITTAWQTTDTAQRYNSDEWTDFETVVDRLNSPPLISIYMRDNFNYDMEEMEEIYLSRTGPAVPAEKTFEIKIGNCGDMARFALHCLINNGYEYASFSTEDNAAVMVGIIPSSGTVGHAICLVKDKGTFYTLDNSIYLGPFPNEQTAIHSSAVLTGIEKWARYVFIDLDLKYTTIVSAASVKVKGLIQEHLIDPWPANTIEVKDVEGDYSSSVKDSRGVDLKLLNIYMDEDYLYLALQIYGNFQNDLHRDYYLEMDFNNDEFYEYIFGIKTNGTVMFMSRPPYGSVHWNDAWYVRSISTQDTIELSIPRKVYKIPDTLSLTCFVTEADPQTIDNIDWVKVR